MRLLLSMGLKPRGRPDEPLRPVLRWLDPHTGAVEDALRRDPPPGLHPPGAEHAEFTGAHRAGDLLWQSTRTEVLALHLPDLAVVRAFTHPLLHDVHDALPLPDGTVAVTSTGLDAVVVLDAAGALVALHRLGDVDPTLHADWRRVPFDSTKPRRVHPNHLLLLGEDLWVTSLELGALMRLRDGELVRLPEGPAHDGRLVDGEIWLTTVAGAVVALDPTTLRRTRTLDLRVLDPVRGVRGWCRGVEKVGDRLFVGLTTLRASAGREALAALVRGPKLPTRVVEIDLRAPRVVASWEVGNAAGGTLYAITAWADAP